METHAGQTATDDFEFRPLSLVCPGAAPPTGPVVGGPLVVTDEPLPPSMSFVPSNRPSPGADARATVLRPAGERALPPWSLHPRPLGASSDHYINCKPVSLSGPGSGGHWRCLMLEQVETGGECRWPA